MSSWDTNFCNFCDPHWEHICCNKWHLGLGNILTTGNSCRDTLLCLTCAKTTPLLLPDDGEASWSLLSSSVSLLSGGTVQPENNYSCIVKVAGQVWESKKKKRSKLITATTSGRIPKPVSTDLTITSHSVLTNPLGKDEVRGWSM